MLFGLRLGLRGGVGGVRVVACGWGRRAVCQNPPQGSATFVRSVSAAATAQFPARASRSKSLERRCFSSEKVQSEGSRQSLEGRYAQALIQAAQAARSLDQVAADAAALKALLSSSPEFEAFARSPGVAADVKIDVVQHMAATFKLSPVTRNFLCTVAENKRMPELAKMLSAFEVLCRAARGEVKDLGASQRREVTAALQKRLGAQAKLLVDFEVDPSVVGGLLVDIDGDTLDLTVASRVEMLRQQMQAPVEA